MANTPYPNYVLENKFADQYQSYLDLMQFCTVDNSLTGEPGMKKKIRTYVATDGTETVAKGEGNTKSITANYTEAEYTIETLQNRFDWYDEDEMEDPLVVDKGLEHQAVDMFNTANKKAIAEFAKATQKVETAKFDFNCFVDAVASIKDLRISESTEITGLGVFALVHKDDVAEIRKNLGDLLKYVEAFARTGYIGTVAGVNIYTSALATKGQFAVATKQAVTYFNKLGAEAEVSTKGSRSAENANKRENTAFLRKYGIFALTDQNFVVKVVKNETASHATGAEIPTV